MLISYSERHKAAGKHPNAMISLKTTIFALLLCNHKSGAQSDGNCGSDCAPNTAPYNLTCLPTGTFSSLTWRRGSTDIILCVASTGQCVPNFGGYNGYKISDSEYVLEILSLDSSTDSEDWICLAGLDVVVTCPLVVREVNATGKLNGSCVKVRDKHKVSCSGLLTPGTPQVDLQIKNDSSIIVSTNTELSLSAIERNALQNNYSCSAQCLTTDYFKCEAAPVPVAVPCDFALIAVIILVVLLVMKIATDVIFVGYRWGDKIGVKYNQICKQIIDTDKKKYILYWICFVQGIIHSICGVTFFIVIFATCTESLGDGLPIAVIVMGIIVGSIGVINIVMCLCCCCCPQSTHDPSPWLCCCCLGTIHPEEKRTPAPSSLPPIRHSMASQRKPPVLSISTTPRALPSPTSDPASDSAVNPSVHLEPLSVEEPKKKKKKRKKRKTTTEAGGESSDQPMNPAGDSDE